MFELNPHSLPDAWWQHLLILIVSGILGYIIAYRRGTRTVEELEDRYALQKIDLENCKQKLNEVKVPIVRPIAVNKIDDFKLIEGIGPKIERLLHQNEILTYIDLSRTTQERIQHILKHAGPRFQMHNPSTWPRQAGLAAAGKWTELSKWQEELDGGLE
jgi:predicted flap endonuclease-1-like 5' DNA nuclease